MLQSPVVSSEVEEKSPQHPSGAIMLFVIDIGNTHTVAGVFKEHQLVKQWRIQTDPQMTSDELGINYHNLFTIAGIAFSAIEGVIISNVVPPLEAAYFSCCRTIFNSTQKPKIFSVTSENVADLITVNLDNPAEVGADRLVNGIAAYSLVRGSVIVIDFGTAITFDCISGQGHYLGGLILPGLSVSLRALIRETAKLPSIDISIPPSSVIGTSTVSAMKSGVLNGYGAMVEGLVTKVKEEMDTNVTTGITVLATGGMAGIVKPFAPSIDRVEPNLTLDGLLFIYEKLKGC